MQRQIPTPLQVLIGHQLFHIPLRHGRLH
jgi:hypothetical protein